MDKQLEQIFEEGCGRGLLSGMVAAAGNSHGNELCCAFGTMHPAADAPEMQPDAVFDLASITKAVATTSAAAYCIDRGLLDPAAPAGLYLPKLAQLPGSTITVLSLATHVSGFGNHKTDHLSPDDAVLDLLQRPPDYLPGTEYIYSCRNFILLGWIMEACSGETLDFICERQFFKPLGMTDAHFGPLHTGDQRIVPTSVPAGIISDEQARNLPKPVGNAGLFSTVGDLAIFSRIMLNACHRSHNNFFGKTSLKWLTNCLSPPGFPRRSFGWDMRSREEVPHRPSSFSEASFGHSGWTGGSLWIDPEQDRYAIVLTNRTAQPEYGKTHGNQMNFRGNVADRLLAMLDKAFD